MTRRDGLFLAHRPAALADIESFTTEGRSAFMADRMTQSAVDANVKRILGRGAAAHD